jgi:hypothetical protein
MVCIEGLYDHSAGWPTSRPHTAGPSSPDLEAAKADQRPRPSKPSQSRNGQPETAGRSRPPVTEDRVPQAHGGNRKPAVIVVALVRAGSAQHQKPLVLGGHERSRPACENPRSQHIHSQDQERRGIEGAGFEPLI